MNATSLTLACAAAAVLASGCTVKQTEVPALTGPSEFAISVSMSATPDTLIAGGTQQAAIVIQARDTSGAPKANQQFRLYTEVEGAMVSFGSFSAPAVVTGSDGRATAVYMMPTFSPFMAGTPARRVSIIAVPVGTDYNGAVSNSVAVLVVPPPVPSGVSGAPTPALTASATTVKVGQLVTFDASQSAASPGSSITGWFWDFGDNLLNDEHGSDASHVWASPGTFTVVLGVVDNTGRVSSTFKTIVVTP